VNILDLEGLTRRGEGQAEEDESKRTQVIPWRHGEAVGPQGHGGYKAWATIENTDGTAKGFDSDPVSILSTVTLRNQCEGLREVSTAMIEYLGVNFESTW
jgi:hypothetical protein